MDKPPTAELIAEMRKEAVERMAKALAVMLTEDIEKAIKSKFVYGPSGMGYLCGPKAAAVEKLPSPAGDPRWWVKPYQATYEEDTFSFARELLVKPPVSLEWCIDITCTNREPHYRTNDCGRNAAKTPIKVHRKPCGDPLCNASCCCTGSRASAPAAVDTACNAKIGGHSIGQPQSMPQTDDPVADPRKGTHAADGRHIYTPGEIERYNAGIDQLCEWLIDEHGAKLTPNHMRANANEVPSQWAEFASERHMRNALEGLAKDLVSVDFKGYSRREHGPNGKTSIYALRFRLAYRQ